MGEKKIPTVKPFNRRTHAGGYRKKSVEDGGRETPQSRGELPYKRDLPVSPQDNCLLRALVSPYLKQQIIDRAHAEGMSISSLVRRILMWYLFSDAVKEIENVSI